MSNACLHRLLSPAPLALQQSVGPLTCQCGPRFNLGSRSVEPWLSAAGSWVWAESTQPFWAQPLLLGDTLAILNLTDSLWPHRLWTLSVIFVSLQVFLQTQFLDRTCSDLSSPPRTARLALSLLLSLHFSQVGLLFAVWFLLTQFPELGYTFPESRG